MIDLQPFEREDIPRLVSWIDSRDLLMLWAGTAFSFPLDQLQLDRHFESSQRVNPRLLMFKAVDPEGGVTGHIELADIDRDNQQATVSRVFVAPDRRRQGICAQMRETNRVGDVYWSKYVMSILRTDPH